MRRPPAVERGALCPLPFLDATSFPQKEILHDEFSFAARKWPTTSAARYLAINGFRSGFNFDDVVEGVAIRAPEERPTRRCMTCRVAR
jgi:hypothetical protein